MCFLGYCKVVWLIEVLSYRILKIDPNLIEVSLCFKEKQLPAAVKKTL